MSPFDYSNSVTKTKDDLSKDPLFEKDYNSFMVNRILSMSPQTAPFASVIDQYSEFLSKEMQYKFYLYGIPKSSKYSKYLKKESVDINKEHLDFICSFMKVSIPRGIEMYSLIGPEKTQEMIDSKGGRK